MKRKYRNYNDLDIIKACKESTSYAQVLNKLDLRSAGGNYKNLQINIKRLSIDISHFKHQAANQDKEFKSFETLIKPASIKSRLIKYRSATCEICKLNTWMGKDIALELHHIDGNNRNNDQNNLLLICPNCHAQTDTYRNKTRN